MQVLFLGNAPVFPALTPLVIVKPPTQGYSVDHTSINNTRHDPVSAHKCVRGNLSLTISEGPDGCGHGVPWRND